MLKLKKSIYLVIILIVLFLPLESPAKAEEGGIPLPDPDTTVYPVNFDQGLIDKGYTIASPDDSFRLGIFPQVLTKPTIFVLKKRNIINYPLPEGKIVLSDFWEFDIGDKQAYDGKKPIIVQMQYQSSTALKEVVFWNGKDWQKLPSQVIDTKNRIIRAYFHLPYARFLVLGNDQIMSEGLASWYKYKGCDCAASPDYPKGTILRVTNINDDKSLEVTVNDFGPERDKHPERVIDLDVVAFKKLAHKSEGLISVLVETVP
jgi:hypothetical protein